MIIESSNDKIVKYILPYKSINVQMNGGKSKYVEQGQIWMKFVPNVYTCTVCAAHRNKVCARCRRLYCAWINTYSIRCNVSNREIHILSDENNSPIVKIKIIYCASRRQHRA